LAYHSPLSPKTIFTKVSARSSPVFALGFRSKEAVRFIGAELYGDIQSRPSFVKDTGGDVIAQSMQLIAGRTAQEYNQRKNRHGTFWEDRYYATAIEADEHLHHCLVYIDLNMVRAGTVNHPREWAHSGYRELQQPAERYAIIDRRTLTALYGFTELGDFQRAHRQWVEQAFLAERAGRDDRWSEAIAVGSLAFVESVKSELGSKAAHRAVEHIDGAYTLREPGEAYNRDLGSESEPLRLENTVSWDENAETAET
jgi:putative transposase